MATFKIIQKTNSDESAAVYIRITHARKKSLVSTGIHVTAEDFNAARQEIRRSHPHYRQYNKHLTSLLRQFEDIAFDLQSKNIPLSAKKVKQVFEQQQQAEEEPVFPLITDLLLRYTSRVSAATAKRYVSVANKIEEAKMDRPANAISLTWLEEYERWMRTVKDNESGTVQTDFNRIKAALNYAERHGEISHEQNPFNKGYKIRNARRTRDIKLEPEHVKALIDYHPKTPERGLTRDIFLFQFFAWGMRIGDALSFRTKAVKNGRLIYTMRKTADPISIKITAPLQDIISRYLDRKHRFLFPCYEGYLLKTETDWITAKGRETAKVNKLLKSIAKELDFPEHLQRRLTSHVARHSYTYLALKSTPLPYLKEMLGHEDINLTMDYAGRLDQREIDSYSDAFYDQF